MRSGVSAYVGDRPEAWGIRIRRLENGSALTLARRRPSAD